MCGQSKSAGKSYDIVALGEALVDFTEAGRSPSGMRLFEQNPGGAPANLLCAAARLGARTSFIGKVGSDMHGRFLKSTLIGAGVDTSGLIVAEDVFTTLAFVALSGGEREFSFARKPGADACLSSGEVDYSIAADTSIFHFGSLSLTGEPVRAATLETARRAKAAAAVISYDPNYRGSLWRSASEAAAQMRAPLPLVDIMKLSGEETVLLSGYSAPKQAAAELCGQGIELVAVTLGGDGVLICKKGECRTVPAFKTVVTDTTGAGDSFWGAFLYQLTISGKTPASITIDEAVYCAGFANAAAAICVSRRGAIPAMPTLEETMALMCRA